MALQVYYPTDIRNALLAAEYAAQAVAQATAEDDLAAVSFLAGYRAALATLALAFGLPVCAEVPPRDRQVISAHTASGSAAQP